MSDLIANRKAAIAKAQTRRAATAHKPWPELDWTRPVYRMVPATGIFDFIAITKEDYESHVGAVSIRP